MQFVFSLRLWNVILFTVIQACVSTFIAIAVGMPAGWLTAKRRFFGKSMFSVITAVPFCVPPLLIALGVVMYYGMNGVINKLAAQFSLPAFTGLYSFGGIVFTHGFYNFPIIMRMCSDAWAKIPPEESDAARLLGAGRFRIFRTITLYQLAPSLASASILVFLYCFFSFIIVLLLGGVGLSTIEVEVYQAVRASVAIAQAVKLAVLETLVALGAVFLYSKLEQNASKNREVSFSSRINAKPVTGIAGKILTALFVLFILVFFAGPLLTILYKSFGSYSILLKRRNFAKSVVSTVTIGFFTACCCVLTGTLYAFFVHVHDFGKKNYFLRLLFPMLPVAVSPVAAGVAIILVFGHGNVASLVVVQTLLFWPFAYKQIISALDKIPVQVEESARLLSVHSVDVAAHIYVPVCGTAFFSAFAFCFAMSAGDTTIPLVLSIPNFETLSLFTYRLAGAYRFNEACAAGMVLALLSAGVFALGKKK